MTYQAIAAMIESIGLPCAYSHFPADTPQVPPFACWIYPGRSDVFGDDKNYQKIETVQLELYTDEKNFSWEKIVEEILAGYDLTWVRSEGYLDDEKMHMTTWRFDVVITPEPPTTTTQEA